MIQCISCHRSSQPIGLFLEVSSIHVLSYSNLFQFSGSNVEFVTLYAKYQPDEPGVKYDKQVPNEESEVSTVH